MNSRIYLPKGQLNFFSIVHHDIGMLGKFRLKFMWLAGGGWMGKKRSELFLWKLRRIRLNDLSNIKGRE